MRVPAFILLTTLLSLASYPVQADITGRASVIDGDTIEIRDQRIRLFGIDAPEGRQRCKLNGKPWRCGQQSTFALAEFIGKAWVRCNERDRDRYKRIVAVCFLGNKNINAWMVRNGWAVDYRRYSLCGILPVDRSLKFPAQKFTTVQEAWRARRFRQRPWAWSLVNPFP